VRVVPHPENLHGNVKLDTSDINITSVPQSVSSSEEIVAVSGSVHDTTDLVAKLLDQAHSWIFRKQQNET